MKYRIGAMANVLFHSSNSNFDKKMINRKVIFVMELIMTSS